MGSAGETGGGTQTGGWGETSCGRETFGWSGWRNAVGRHEAGGSCETRGWREAGGRHKAGRRWETSSRRAAIDGKPAPRGNSDHFRRIRG